MMATRKACPLCRHFDKDPDPNLTNKPLPTPERQIWCRRCGGFIIDLGLDEDGIPAEQDGIRLSYLARRCFEQDPAEPLHVSGKEYERQAAEARTPRSSAAYLDRLILEVGDACKYPGRNTTAFNGWRLAALTCLPTDAAMASIRQLRQAGIVELSEGEELRLTLALTVEGWQRYDEATRSRPQPDHAFLAMWFEKRMQPASDVVEAVLQECGYKPPFRVDDLLYEKLVDEPGYKNKIDDRVLAEIRRSRFVVADVTGARQNVYYEAGFAEGLGIPVIWCCNKKDVKKLAFDTRQIGHLVWENPKHLEKLLRDRIRARGWSLGE